MDKCREEFEKQRYWIGLFRTGVDFDVTLGEFGRYISNGTKSTDAMDLESFNEKWEAWANCWQHQQAKVDELQTLYTQQGINMLKLQKRVDALEGILQKCLLHGIDSVVIEGSQATTMRDRIQQILDGEK